MQAEDVALDICNVVKGAEGKLPKPEIQRGVVAALGELFIQGVITADNLLDSLLSVCERSKSAVTELHGLNNRSELLKEALLLLLGAQLAPQLKPHPELGLWDDEVIKQFETQIEQRIATLPADVRSRIQSVAANLEADPKAIGTNVTLAHALAVEAFVSDFIYGEPSNAPLN
jgi:hypothetical protein